MGFCYISHVTDRYLNECDEWEQWCDGYDDSDSFSPNQEAWLVSAAQYALIVDGVDPIDLPDERDYHNSLAYENDVIEYREDVLRSAW